LSTSVPSPDKVAGGRERVMQAGRLFNETDGIANIRAFSMTFKDKNEKQLETDPPRGLSG
ncbi:hypothetical protein, partial [Staphylococcus aureus]|jgi:hypothetical protein